MLEPATAPTTGAEAAPSTAALRWPLKALLTATGLTPTGLARRLRVAKHAVVTAGRDGLTDHQADTWAIRAGLHPALVWGSAWITTGLHADDTEADTR